MALMVFLLIAGGIIYLVVDTTNKREFKRKQLQEAYQRALASGNKGHASLAGRAYYSYLRNGIPTLADEATILNDIVAMP
ncbi:hypothetical protein [Spirosoma fluviale]|uniref:Uncharacterized protein n=1 Tax=Spirosoma fluviale TaxID=1597977 RepID=A0A286GMQ0_9BACT|nr:hypothetical protein [Spirosoma fluviale]SOD96780.1 hypothetical protein SAMN06269250_5495 [Spirosoma fluviale]